MRDCESCKNHTDKGCTKWKCEFEPTTKNDLGVDCISRAEAIKCLECDFDITGKENMKTVVNYINSAHEKIMNLPRVKQEPKTGEWIEQNDDYFDWYECSECGYGSEGEMQYSSEYDVRTNYCPHCGAKMVEPQADKEQNE